MDNKSVPRLCPRKGWQLSSDVVANILCCSLGRVTGELLVGFWSVSGLVSPVEGEGVAR